MKDSTTPNVTVKKLSEIPGAVAKLRNQHPELCEIAKQLWTRGYRTPATQIDKLGLSNGRASQIVRSLKMIETYVWKYGFFHGELPVVYGDFVYDGKHRMAHALAHGLDLQCVVISSSPKLSIADIDTAASYAQELWGRPQRAKIPTEPVPISDLETLSSEFLSGLELGNMQAREDAAVRRDRFI